MQVVPALIDRDDVGPLAQRSVVVGGAQQEAGAGGAGVAPGSAEQQLERLLASLEAHDGIDTKQLELTQPMIRRRMSSNRGAYAGL